ncbi:MAG: GntR family transcriptional regulator [Lentisphaerota bacterium]
MRKTPIKEKLAGSIRKELLDAGHAPGTRLPSEKDYAGRFNVSHLTVRAALDILEKEGLLKRKPGSGTFLKCLPGQNGKRPVSDDRLVAVAMRTEGHFFSDLHHYISLALQQHGLITLSIPLKDYDNDWKAFNEQLQSVRRRGCRRIMLEKNAALWKPPLCNELGLHEGSDELWDRIVWIGIQQTLPDFIRGKLVCTDYEDLLIQAIKIFKAAGRKRVSFLTRPPIPHENFPDLEWYPINSFCRIMTEEGMGAGIMVNIQGDEREKNIAELVELFKSPNRPNALMSTQDFRAVMALEAAGIAGLKVPEELAIIGDLDTPWSHAHNLSSFSRNPSELARHIADLVKCDKKAYDASPRFILVNPAFVGRRSCTAKPIKTSR